MTSRLLFAGLILGATAWTAAHEPAWRPSPVSGVPRGGPGQPAPATLHATPDTLRWSHLSSVTGDLPVPNGGTQQTASLVADVDGDGVNDFLLTERTQAPAVVWYRRGAGGWAKYVVEAGPLRIEAGGAAHDVDGDGDVDVVFGGESQSNEVWWWENPAPAFDPAVPWQRHLVKHAGAPKHHDELFGDFDGDGAAELAFWNQGAQTLYLAEIPADPRAASRWPLTVVYAYGDDSQMPQRGTYPGWKGINEHEGLATADVDGDGVTDLVGGGRWFKRRPDGTFQENLIDAAYPFTRAAVGQLIEGGRPEVVLVAGDGTAPLVLYAWQEGTWVPHVLLEEVRDGHSLDLIDVDGDGHLDVFTAEMHLAPDAQGRARLLLGDGAGHFETHPIATGFGMHEARIADLDGDGDYDVLAKPYAWETPRIDVWLQE